MKDRASRRRGRHWPLILAASLAAGRLVGVHFGSVQAADAPATQPAATQPATQPVPSIRLNFKDTPLDSVLEHLSQDAGFVIVKDAPVDGRVTIISLQPVTPEQAVLLLDTVLKGNGLAAIQEGRTLHIVARDKAKKGNVPVHYGSDPQAIEPTDQIITQVIPIKNIDAVKLRQDLLPLIGTDADVAANSGSNAMILTDTSSNIRRIVEIISRLDRTESTTSVIKIVRLQNASAASAARLVLSIFRPEEAHPANPKAPPAPAPEGRIPGSGVDQALHGAKITAAADERTNSVVVAGPNDTVKLIEAMLHELDTNPVTVSTIKSFHLKLSNAEQVAKLITSLFHEEQTGQVRAGGGADQPLRAHVTVASEERTNTVIVTAPSSVMTVIEGIIRDLESNPAGESGMKSYHLKYADADGTAKELMAVFEQNEGRRYRFREHMNATADERTNTVIITASPAAMKEVDGIIADLDAQPNKGWAVEFFHLKQADAVGTAKLIDNFFKPPDNEDRRAAQLSPHLGVVAEADERSNTVMVTAPPESMKVVDDIVKELETDPSMALDVRSYALQYADATNAAKLITSMFQGDQQGGGPGQAKPTGRDLALRSKVVAAADDRTNTVVVTAPVATLRVISNMVRLLDANPITSADIKVFQLQYADASTAAKLLESIFQTPQSQTNSSQNKLPPGASAELSRHNWVNASADDRTNTLVVTAPPDVLKIAEAIVAQLDSNPASEETFFIYRLRNGQAENLSMVLNQLFGNYAGGAPGAAGRPGQNQGFGSFGGGFGQGRSGLGSNRSSFGRGVGSFGGAGGSSFGSRFGAQNGSFGGNRNALSQLSPGMARAASQLTGQAFVVADLDTNSLLVTTATKYQNQVRAIIEELDRPVPQVLIKVLIAEVTHNNSADLGTDFSVLNTRPNGLGESIGQAFGNPGSGLVAAVVENKLNVQLHALAVAGKLDVLSRPYILASDNQLASILVGSQVPIIVNSQLTALGQTINTIQYDPVGIELDVTPHINPDGLVIMDVAPSISQLTDQSVPISSNVSAPVIAQRSAQSRVGIRDGQTVVIGGMMQDNKTSTVNKVPILGDIPILQWVFSRTEITKTKTELLIFLTPHVAQEPQSLKPMSDDEMKGARLVPSAVGPGTFQEHLRGMDRGAVPATRPTTTSPNQPALQFSPATTEPAGPGTLHLPQK